MNYKNFFGFQDDPFRLTPDTQYFFPSASHQSALETLRYFFASNEGFALIVGEAGTGKTLLLRLALKDLPPGKEVALILTPNLDPTELLTAIVRDLGLEKEGDIPRDKDQLIKLFSQYLLSRAQEGKGVIIVIDEAQNLPMESLEQLRLLSNLETEKKKLLQILLVGQPELMDKIRDPRLRQLDQRITIKEELLPLSMKETEEYIFFRLSRAGKGNITVEKGAIREAYRLSGGIPRKINAIFSRALLLAYAEGTHTLNRELIKKAYQSISLDKEKASSLSAPLKALILGGLLLLCLLILYLTYQRRVEHPPASPPATATRTQTPPTAKPQKPTPPPAPPSTEKETNQKETLPPEDLYQKGLKYVRSGQMEAGREVLKRFLSLYPQHPLADNALYWLGMSYFYQGEWNKALDYFTQAIERYPKGNKIPYALLKRADIFLKENQKDKAAADLERLVREFPHTEVAKKAQEMLNKMRGDSST